MRSSAAKATGHHLQLPIAGVMPWWERRCFDQLAGSGQRERLHSIRIGSCPDKLALPAVDIDVALKQLMEAIPGGSEHRRRGEIRLGRGVGAPAEINTEPIIRVYAEGVLTRGGIHGVRFKNELQGFLRALED